jgi:hypothetical protein
VETTQTFPKCTSHRPLAACLGRPEANGAVCDSWLCGPVWCSRVFGGLTASAALRCQRSRASGDVAGRTGKRGAKWAAVFWRVSASHRASLFLDCVAGTRLRCRGGHADGKAANGSQCWAQPCGALRARGLLMPSSLRGKYRHLWSVVRVKCHLQRRTHRRQPSLAHSCPSWSRRAKWRSGLVPASTTADLSSLAVPDSRSSNLSTCLTKACGPINTPAAEDGRMIKTSRKVRDCW